MATTIELNTNELKGVCQRYLSKDDESRCTAATHDKDEADFQVLGYKLKPASDAPTGFLGRHQILSVEILMTNVAEVGSGQQLQKLNFFTKSAPTEIASRMEYLEQFGVFKKEILVYREVLPQLQQIFAVVTPKCYYADNNLLIFENLAAQGYKMAAARDGLLNYAHLNCSLKTLAALHASSIVFEVRQGGKKLIDEYADAVLENAYPADLDAKHVRMQNFHNCLSVMKEIIKLLPKYQHNLEYILHECPKKMARIFDLAKVSTKYQNVFSHGDLWANNIMFQYGKFGETPIQCRFVDFQLARYAPPMLDLMTVLSIPTSRSFREQYLTELLCNYYRYMEEFLKRENLNIADFISKQHFDECAQQFRIAGLIESILFSHMTVLPTELTQQLTGSEDGFNDFFQHKRVEICMHAFNNDQVYRERLTDMIEDFVDNFVLQ